MKLSGATPAGTSFTLDCFVINYSEEGISLRLGQPITVPSAIRVLIGKDAYNGEVRHCRKSPFGYYAVGVKLQMR